MRHERSEREEKRERNERRTKNGKQNVEIQLLNGDDERTDIVSDRRRDADRKLRTVRKKAMQWNIKINVTQKK